MSLIQDALKRKNEESAHSMPQPPKEPSSLPPREPPPHPAPQQAPEDSPKKTRALPVILGLLGILIGLAALSLLSRPEQPKRSAASEPSQQQLSPQPEPAPQPQPAPATNPVPTPEPTPTAPETNAAPPAAEWPELIYSGSAASGDQALAIINGRMLSEGNRIGDVTILKIGKNEVLVERQGEERILRVDGN